MHPKLGAGTNSLKYNRAAVRGFRLVRVRPEQVESGEVFGLLDAVLGG